MNIDRFNSWLREETDTRRNVYILIGPPAVGKTSWIESSFKDGNSIVISKDEIIEDTIFPKYKLANNDIFAKPDQSATIGQTVAGREKLGTVGIRKRFSRSQNKEVEEKIFKEAFKAGEELNNIYDKQIEKAISSGTKNIVIDAMHMNKNTRADSIDRFKGKGFKIIGVIFPHAGYESQIKKSADLRAKDFLERYGPEFDRNVSFKDYQEMYSKYESPSTSEGFDEIVQEKSRFSKTDKELGLDKGPTDEDLVDYSRNFLGESRLSKYWRRRMEARSKHARRESKNKIDREWAELQQEKSRSMNQKIHKIFEREMEVTEELSKEIDEFIQRVKNKRQEHLKKLQEKAKFKSPKDKRSKKTLPNPYKDAKVTDKYPFSKDRTGGVAKVYRKRSKASGGPTAAPGEAFGPGE